MRDEWSDYFMKIADQVATRATCDRKHVGAVIVRDRRILATGYNGSMPGAAHCDDVGHLMEDGHCVATIHAEVNAITQAAAEGIAVKGAEMYCNTFPCWSCFKSIVAAGIRIIIYKDAYRPDPKVVEHAKMLHITLMDINEVSLR